MIERPRKFPAPITVTPPVAQAVPVVNGVDVNAWDRWSEAHPSAMTIRYRGRSFPSMEAVFNYIKEFNMSNAENITLIPPNANVEPDVGTPADRALAALYEALALATTDEEKAAAQTVIDMFKAEQATEKAPHVQPVIPAATGTLMDLLNAQGE